jgi:predicted nucleic acid-binding Zn ribbon protein
VGESLERLARHLGTPPPEALTRLFEGWEELVGAAVAAHARPLSLARGVLAVAVDQPGWAAQLGWLETDLLRRFEERLGTGVVTSIAVRVRPG